MTIEWLGIIFVSFSNFLCWVIAEAFICRTRIRESVGLRRVFEWAEFDQYL